MHNSRNRLALGSVALGSVALADSASRSATSRSAKGRGPHLDPPTLPRGGFMLRERAEPAFPEDILIARPALPGARIVALPDEPEPKAPAKKKAAAKPGRKTTKRKAPNPRKAALKKKAPAKKAKAKTARAGSKKAKPEMQLPPPPCLPVPLAEFPLEAALAPLEPNPIPQIPAGLLFAAGMAKVPPSASVSAEDRVPVLMLPRNRSLAKADRGIVSRLVTWLGSLLPRKRKRAALPRSRQKLAPANLHK